jgi:hypothetical protein
MRGTWVLAEVILSLALSNSITLSDEITQTNQEEQRRKSTGSRPANMESPILILPRGDYHKEVVGELQQGCHDHFATTTSYPLTSTVQSRSSASSMARYFSSAEEIH